MGWFKEIKKSIPPDEINVSGGIENLMRDIADDSTEFENMLVEYGIECFIKKMDKKVKNGKRKSIPEFLEISKDTFIENPLLTNQRVIDYCQDQYIGSVDICGEDDIYNTFPAKKAMEDAIKVQTYLETIQELT